MNSVAVKKPEAKKQLMKHFKAKEEAEIDANNDLTAEEKQAAKEETKKKAKMQLSKQSMKRIQILRLM